MTNTPSPTDEDRELIERVARAICGRELAYVDCETACMSAGKCVGKLSEGVIADARAAIEATIERDSRPELRDQIADIIVPYIAEDDWSAGVQFELAEAILALPEIVTADRLESLLSDRAKLEEALRLICETVSRRQLPITNQVYEIATAVLNRSTDRG